MKKKLTQEEKIAMAVIMTTAALEGLNTKIETSIAEKQIVKKLKQNRKDVWDHLSAHKR